MVSSYSSSSSFTSSSLGRPPTFTNSSGAGPSSTWVPATSPSVVPGSQNPPALDLGPPGYEATITLYPETKDEKTVYLGPWQITSTTEGICVVWQCSYQDEVLEHFIPCESPSDIYPHTSHAHHRPYHEPSDMERSIVFTDSHHVRYTNEEGETVHDQPITVRYEFTSVDSSRNFQTELRGKELVSFFDADVAWTDLHDRTDAFGQVRGIAVAQRIKLWLDNRTNRYSITILANKLPGRRYMEYDLQMFEREMRERKEHKKQVQLAVQSRRSSGSSQGGRKFSFSRKQRQNSSNSMAETASSSKRERDMRHLYFRFSNREGYRAFVQSWKHAQGFPEAQIPIPFHPQSYQLSTPELSPPSTTANQHSSTVSPLTQASSYQISPNTQASSAFTQTSAASYTSQTSYNTSHGSYASSPDLEHSMSRRLEIVREPDEA